MSEPKLPRGAVRLAAEALREAGVHPGDDGEIARMALMAALPLIERHVRRETAREVLALEAEDRKRWAYAKGPYGDMRTSLRRLERGEPLPRPEELRGGNDGLAGARPDRAT